MALLDSARNRPNFFIIGAAKAGTTRLHYLLGQHPAIFGSSRKEPNLFNHESPSQEQFERYGEFFRVVGAATAIGEASVSYSRSQLFPGTARRIFEFNPGARIIYMVRHPLKRIESDWVQARANNNGTSGNFLKAVRSQAPFILDTSLYWKQLSQYREFFPDNQILLLFFEEFIRDEPAALRSCFNFLGVEPDAFVDTSVQERQNPSQGKRVMSPLRSRLRYVAPLRLAWDRVPEAMRDKISPGFLQSVCKAPVWDEATWVWARDQVRPDAEKILAHAAKPVDYWKWDFGPTVLK